MVSKLLVVVAAVLLQQSISAQEFPGTLVNSAYSSVSLLEFKQTCNASGIYTACDSCTSNMVCILGDKESKACPVDKPYCTNNACSATISSQCTPNPLKCTGVGYYPDPKACQYYHFCEATGQTSSVYDCKPGNVFNAATTLCKQKRLATDCVTVTCDPNKTWQSYGTSKTYYAYCSATEIKMVKCPTNYFFNGAECVFQCPKEGNFAHIDPEKFFECILIGTKLIPNEIQCPVGKEFNSTIGICLTKQA